MATGDVYPSSIFSVELGKFQVETVQSVSVPSIQIEVVETRQVSATGEPIVRKQPAPRPQSGEITITRGMDPSTAFTDWIHTSLENKDIAAARQNMSIVQYDIDKKPVLRYHLTNAWASQLKGADLDASSNGAATEQVTITYEDCAVERAS
ncbi:phage tail protein [Streptomyces formicae]|uniref:Phage tail protein n=1 Tax=Streptomyces formicae TaxID=1616117 RepID=A0ABY3WKT4_9ACTN|nr:phage tail protein [Streptomyces formicae]UNM13201.1 phage tail protein [Streptomyces formicae]